MEMEKDMENNTDKAKKWAAYFKAHKEVWHNPQISPYVKCFIGLLQLHRSDSQGWSLSIRLVSQYLGIAPNTARKAINEALKEGLIETNTKLPRKRRKLRLSVSLRAPVGGNPPASDALYHQVTQPVLPPDTDSESPEESVNIQEKYINANTEKSQVKPEKKIEEPIPYKEEKPQGSSEPQVIGESEGLKKLRERMRTLGWKEKS